MNQVFKDIKGNRYRVIATIYHPTAGRRFYEWDRSFEFVRLSDEGSPIYTITEKDFDKKIDEKLIYLI